MVERLETILFAHRGWVLTLLAVFTGISGWAASGIHLDTAFESQLPSDHPYVETFLEYQDEVRGVNRVVVALRTTRGDIWNPEFFRKLSEATDALAFLPGIDRRTVTSLWTPNIRHIEITEDGMRGEDMIGSDVTLETLSQADVDRTRDRVLGSGLVGNLVSRDFTTAMVVAEALDVGLDAAAGGGGVLELAERLETDVRQPLLEDGYDVHVIGFVRMIGDIADGARDVVVFFALALLLTGLAVYGYSRSVVLTLLPLGCSLVSGVWQFGTMVWLDYGVDPLAILVPFLVFAVGVSHGIQQINLIARRVTAGDAPETAARVAFRGLLVPGSMALVTDGIAFATLLLIPIPMVRDLGATAAIGIGYKIVSNLVLLPLLASYFELDDGFAERNRRSQAMSRLVMSRIGALADARRSPWVLVALAALLAVAVVEGRGRHVGDLHPGATELRPDSRYNRDARVIAEKFDFGLDVLTVLAETREGSCIDYATLDHLDRFSWHMGQAPGVTSVMSTPVVAKFVNAAWNEGRLEWRALPRNRWALAQVTSSIPSGLGVFNADCTLMPVQVYTSDHRAETIEGVVAAAEAFIEAHPSDRVRLRMASGNVGIQAATNESLERSELPMMLCAYASIVLLVMLTYRDWRAVLCCALPLAVATFLGYAFMKHREIGLKVSTLPVMVLAVGIGVDYAFYIYNRLAYHLDAGRDVVPAVRTSLLEVGNAVVFTGITLAVGVATWAFSALRFQADMGLLLAFMFTLNMVMSVAALPSLAVVLHRAFPRRRGGGSSS
jgi:predicted RND superfamily exporter protein